MDKSGHHQRHRPHNLTHYISKELNDITPWYSSTEFKQKTRPSGEEATYARVLVTLN